MGLRRYSAADRILGRLGNQLEALSAAGSPASRGEPSNAVPAEDRTLSANLMRVNHAGEVAAQALYKGQALTAGNSATRRYLLESAEEERAHLEWCEKRLIDLGDRPSHLKPLWYGGSYLIGALAGLMGDRWSLGFVAETEKQVSDHLEEHISRLPSSDEDSRKILRDMQADEQRHGEAATHRGGRRLPTPVKGMMRLAARIMKFGAFRI